MVVLILLILAAIFGGITAATERLCWVGAAIVCLAGADAWPLLVALKA